MEEGFEDWTSDFEPVLIIFHPKLLPSSFRNYLQKPPVKGRFWKKRLESFDNGRGVTLKAEDFEALMIKAIDEVIEML